MSGNSYAVVTTSATPAKVQYGSLESPLNKEDALEGKVIFDGSKDIPWASNHDLVTPTTAKYQDVSFTVAFLIHLAIVFYLFAMKVGENVSFSSMDSVFGVKLSASYVTLLVLSSVYIVVAQVLFLQKFALVAVYSAMILNFSFTLLLSFAMIASGSFWGIIVGLILIWASVTFFCFTFRRYARFSASNLKVAASAITANLGLFALGSIIGCVLMMWSGIISVLFKFYFDNNNDTSNCDDDCDMDMDMDGVDLLIYFLLLCSFIWTWLVSIYVGQVTVAGVVGTYWTVPQEAESCCSSALVNSFIRSVSFSFGSICKGALILAVVKALRVLSDQLRDQERRNNNAAGSFLLCILTCILQLLEDIIEYANKWALSYIGLYGFNYIDACKEVLSLLKNRGWDAIVTDDISSYVTFMFTLITGLLTGGVAIVLPTVGILANSESVDKMDLFCIGLLLGLFIGAILFNFVGGAVNTTIICFAEMPGDLERNHPKLSEEMRSSWLDTFPSCGLPVAVVV